MSYCRCHGRPYGECPSETMARAIRGATASQVRTYTVRVYNLREHTSAEYDMEAWTAEDAVTQAKLRHCNSRDADGRPVHRIDDVRPGGAW